MCTLSLSNFNPSKFFPPSVTSQVQNNVRFKTVVALSNAFFLNQYTNICVILSDGIIITPISVHFFTIRLFFLIGTKTTVRNGIGINNCQVYCAVTYAAAM